MVAEIWQDQGPVSVSLGCYNKVPQIEQLKITGISSIEVLEDRSLKRRCWPCSLWSFLVRICSSMSFSASGAANNPWCSLAVDTSFHLFLCLHVLFFLCVCASIKTHTLLSVSSLPSHYTQSHSHYSLPNVYVWEVNWGWEGKFPKWSSPQIFQAPAGSSIISDITPRDRIRSHRLRAQSHKTDHNLSSPSCRCQ